MSWSLAVFVVIVLVTASGGALFKPGDWYERLEKPGWTPPNWAFPVVWSVLFLMMAFAGWLVWRIDPGSVAIWFWGIQLVVNWLWSALFFGMRRMDYAFVDVSVLWLLILGFIVTAWPISMTAALLFVPYLVWVTIASALNLTVWRMNSRAMA